jgi:hypothetical protein
VGENKVKSPLNCTFYGATETCPFQIIILASSTQPNNPIIQSTVDRQPIESQEDFWERLSARASELVKPYGHEHFILMFCRNYPLRDHLSDDIKQNASRQQGFVADHNKRYDIQAKALCTMLDFQHKAYFRL